jgi:hypothetical protein
VLALITVSEKSSLSNDDEMNQDVVVEAKQVFFEFEACHSCQLNLLFSPSKTNGAAGQTKIITLKCIREKYEKGLALTAVTAYDYSSAIHVIFFQSS